MNAQHKHDMTDKIIGSRKRLIQGLPVLPADPVEEGGCGVVGFAASVPIRGRNIFEASIQMHNRGNGKGGGVAAAGLVPEELGVSAEVLKDSYILQVALPTKAMLLDHVVQISLSIRPPYGVPAADTLSRTYLPCCACSLRYSMLCLYPRSRLSNT